ncbi:MAG: (2Fe-2S)-binding protein [Terriglobales bacterium]
MANISRINVNGSIRRIEADEKVSLLSVLRDQLDLTGTKYGCGEGACGACTVLIEGQWRRSCITPVGALGEKKIVTIEGLAKGDRLHPLQQAFIDEAAMQCAYCTSGMIMTAMALLKTKPDPSEAEIAQFMEGNVCRCGTHPRIMAAIVKGAKILRDAGPAKESGR